jgi:DNA-binding transcriptional MerR regulator
MHKSTAGKLKEAGARPAYPEKLFYKIGEVSKIADVEPYVLRYWETEFPFLKPRKSKSGQRIYVKKDLDLIFEIKEMLYSERLTIEGVRKRLSDGGAAPVPHRATAPAPSATTVEAPAPGADAQLSLTDPVAMVKRRLRDILRRLDA